METQQIAHFPLHPPGLCAVWPGLCEAWPFHSVRAVVSSQATPFCCLMLQSGKDTFMDRRTFLGVAASALAAEAFHSTTLHALPPAPLKPMEVGLLVSPFGAPEATFK